MTAALTAGLLGGAATGPAVGAPRADASAATDTPTTTTTTPIACDAAPPDVTVQMTALTSLTFGYVAHGSLCGASGPTLLQLDTEKGDLNSLAGSGSGSAPTGTITITGLAPGTDYFYVASGGGTSLTTGFRGPVTTTGTPASQCVPAVNRSLVMSRLPLPAGWSNVDIVAINRAGTVVANAFDPTAGAGRSVMWDAAGRFTVLAVPAAGGSTYASDLNAYGTVIGTARTPAGPQAVIWRNGLVATLPGPEGGDAAAIAVSDDGSVVGNWNDRMYGTVRAVRWDATGRVSRLPTLAGPGFTVINRGNHAGQAVGSWRSTDPAQLTHTLFWDRAGRLTDLQATPDAPRMRLTMLSETGTVLDDVGVTWNQARGFRHLTAPPGVPGIVYTRAINAYGTVLGVVSALPAVAPYRWSAGGTPQPLRWPTGSTEGSVTTLNDRGVAIGQAVSDLVPHGIRWPASGAPEDLGGVTSCDTSEAEVINNAGLIAGTITLQGAAAGARIPVVWRPVARS